VSSNESFEDKTANDDVSRSPTELLTAPALNKKRSNPRGRKNQLSSTIRFPSLITSKLKREREKKESIERREKSKIQHA
jgi:hypothetical protein